MNIILDTKRLWVLCVFKITVHSCDYPKSLFHLSVLLNGSWDYCANFEMDLIFPKIAFIVMKRNLGTVEQSLGKSGVRFYDTHFCFYRF